MTKYAWAPGTPIHLDPQVAAIELLGLRTRLGRDLVGDDLVHHAQDPTSCLHDYFVWNDVEAAAYYRREQAQIVLRGLHDAATGAPIFVRLRIVEIAPLPRQSSYVLVSTLTNPQDQRDVLMRMARELQGHARQLRALGAVWRTAAAATLIERAAQILQQTRRRRGNGQSKSPHRSQPSP